MTVTAVPAIFQIATLPFCPESPKYLLLDKDDEHGAEEGVQDFDDDEKMPKKIWSPTQSNANTWDHKKHMESYGNQDVILLFSALQWLRGTIEVHDEMDEMKQEQESMKLVPKV